MALPRIFHHIWLGSTPLPPDFAAFRETWREHHPEWALRLWTEEELPDGLSRRELYDLSRLPAERADVLRLEVLQRFGGIYVDVDLECRRPLDELLDRVEFFACYLSDPRAGSAVRIGNGIVGATRGHPIVELALDQVRFSDDGSLDKAATGTVLFW
jgi:mannosyltransferase OCH1-like enzyme